MWEEIGGDKWKRGYRRVGYYGEVGVRDRDRRGEGEGGSVGEFMEATGEGEY